MTISVQPSGLKRDGQHSIGPLFGIEEIGKSGGSSELNSGRPVSTDQGISFGSISKNLSVNVVENGPKTTGSNSTWASLFGTSPDGSLPYTQPKTIGDNIIVVPSEEVIAQNIRVWENSLVGQLINVKLPYAVIHQLVEKIWGKIEMPVITILENDLICF